jgi:hypothetical protein
MLHLIKCSLTPHLWSDIKMSNDSYAVYAQFLVQCRKVMGPFDIEKLSNDNAYKNEFFNRVKLSDDDELFQLANLVNQKLAEEALEIKH